MKVFTLKMNGRVYTEEVPTMSASSGAIAGLPPDEPPVRKRKRKFKTDIFQRIRNARLKEETMEDQNIISEADNQNTEVSSAMRMIQTKRKLQKKQEREKRAANRKQEIAALSKAKAKDYQKKAGERQKKISKDINTVAKSKDKKEGFDWQGVFSQLNEQFATLSQEQQEKFLKTWLQMSEENQDKFVNMISENFEKASAFVETL
tara:strand:- start:465 stop:1079 length:615 start_codon:yes stop_codon:yes gene_type:complete